MVASDKSESIVVAAIRDPSQTVSADLPPIHKSADPGRRDPAQLNRPGFCRRPFGLSYAAMAGCSSMA
jgi:hypothetical protein